LTSLSPALARTDAAAGLASGQRDLGGEGLGGGPGAACGSRGTPMSCAPRIPDTRSVAPVLPTARTPTLRGVPSLITHTWYARSAPGGRRLTRWTRTLESRAFPGSGLA